MLTVKSVVTVLALTWAAGANAAHESTFIFPSKAAYSPEASLQERGMAGRAGVNNTTSGTGWIFPRLANPDKQPVVEKNPTRVSSWVFSR